MKVRYDERSDALHLRLVETEVAESEEVSPGVVLDYDASGQVIGIEVLGLSRRTPGIDPRRIEVEVG